LADEGELELQGGKALEGAVMQPARNAAPIFILELQQASGKRVKNLFIPFLVGKIRNDDAKAIDSWVQAIDRRELGMARRTSLPSPLCWSAIQAKGQSLLASSRNSEIINWSRLSDALASEDNSRWRKESGPPV
jgi:hypothetical protein